MSESASPAFEFEQALRASAPRFNVHLSESDRARLTEYYRHVFAWNARLHLVAPCSPVVFATRHVLESLIALRFFSNDGHVVDVGSGAGLPIVPCLIVRSDLRATLVESSPKKCVFLSEAIQLMKLNERAEVVTARFENIRAPEGQFVTCRALDRFTRLFPKLVVWSPPTSALLLFGGRALQEQIEKAHLTYKTVLLPESDGRFLFVVEQRSASL